MTMIMSFFLAGYSLGMVQVFVLLMVTCTVSAFNITEEVSTSCQLGFFPCGNLSTCLPQVLHCNGVDDCGNQADEENCGDNNGWPHLFDKFFGMPSHNTRTKSTSCLLGLVPELCQCEDLELDCDRAQLHNIPVVAVNITKMSLQRNHLQRLKANAFIIYRSLQKLYLQHNEIEDVNPAAFRGLYNLTRLYLNYNRISVLMPGVFRDLHKLEWLILENNNIHHISPKAFSGLNSLVLLALLNNTLTKLDDICHEMARLNWLDLEGNLIETLENVSFYSCSMLTVLVLQRNRISHIHDQAFSVLQKLGELDLSSNRLKKIPHNLFVLLGDLLQLNLSYNPIVELQVDHFDKLHKLKSLSIEGIEISNIQSRMFEPLKHLTHMCRRIDGDLPVHDRGVRHKVPWRVQPSRSCLDGQQPMPGNRFPGHAVHRSIGPAAYLSHFGEVHLHRVPLPLPDTGLASYRHGTPGYLGIRFHGSLPPPGLQGAFPEFLRYQRCVLPPALRAARDDMGARLLHHHLSRFESDSIPDHRAVIRQHVLQYPAHRDTDHQVHQPHKKGSDHRQTLLLHCHHRLALLDPYFHPQDPIPAAGTITSWVVIFILPINSALNPILYTLTTRPFKETLMQVWANYRQRRPAVASHPIHHPSLTGQEMWPLQDSCPAVGGIQHTTDTPPARLAALAENHTGVPV
ncbi:relaxin receptor 1 isoform X3 [Stigmatopora argus]